MPDEATTTVADLMTRDVRSVTPDEYLLVLNDLFRKHRIHHLLVVEDGALVGVISDRDVLRAISPFLGTTAEQHRDARTLEMRAREIMTRQPITITPEAPIQAAASLLLAHDISCLPVVSDGGTVHGIITSRDVLRQNTDDDA
jgi:acetoin utilization protein AcuB